MDPADRAQRAVALRAIADKTKELEDAGADPITVKTFSAGAVAPPRDARAAARRSGSNSVRDCDA